MRIFRFLGQLEVRCVVDGSFICWWVELATLAKAGWDVK
jgi:hypothetical protein